MYMKLTEEGLESLEYRRERLDEKMERLEAVLSGRGKKLLPLVRDESGAHSERGTWDLIEDLLKALEAAERHELSDKQRALFSSFLYCAIRTVEEDPWWLVETKGSFHDILRLGKGPWPKSKLELGYMELYRGTQDDFFDCMDELYYLFTGKRVTHALSEAEREQIRALDPEESAAIEEQWRGQEEFIKDLRLGVIVLDEDECVDDSLQEEEQEQKEWAAAVAEKETLCREYLRFRELYFDTIDVRLPQRLRQMLDVYLAGRGASPYLDDDLFFETYARLDEVARRLRSELFGKG